MLEYNHLHLDENTLDEKRHVVACIDEASPAITRAQLNCDFIERFNLIRIRDIEFGRLKDKNEDNNFCEAGIRAEEKVADGCSFNADHLLIQDTIAYCSLGPRCKPRVDTSEVIAKLNHCGSGDVFIVIVYVCAGNSSMLLY